jgi:hypothetical protein
MRASSQHFANTPPAKDRWLQVTAESRIASPKGDLQHTKIIIRLIRLLILDVSTHVKLI